MSLPIALVVGFAANRNQLRRALANNPAVRVVSVGEMLAGYRFSGVLMTASGRERLRDLPFGTGLEWTKDLQLRIRGPEAAHTFIDV